MVNSAEHADRRRRALPRRRSSAPARLAAIARVVGEDNFSAFDANALAETLFGDAVFANMIMLGFAWQQGLVPVSLDALTRAIELNGVAVERNIEAFAAGRLAAAEPDFAASEQQEPPRETLDEIIAPPRRLPDGLPGRRLGVALSRDCRTRARGGKASRLRGADRSGGARAVQADVL